MGVRGSCDEFLPAHIQGAGGRERVISVGLGESTTQIVPEIQRSFTMATFQNGSISSLSALVLCQRRKLATSKWRWLTWRWHWCRWCTQSLLSRDSGMWRSWFSSRSTLQIWREIETWPTGLGLSFSPPVDESDSANCNWSNRTKNDAENSTKPTRTFPGTASPFFSMRLKTVSKKKSFTS